MTDRLPTGRYMNHTFVETLDKDLPYCEFILSMKHVSKNFLPFQEWLKTNIQSKRNAEIESKIAKLSKQQ